MAKYKSLIMVVLGFVAFSCCALGVLSKAVGSTEVEPTVVAGAATSTPTVEPSPTALQATVVTTDTQKQCLADVYAWSKAMGEIVDDETTDLIQKAMGEVNGKLGSAAVAIKLAQIANNPAPECDPTILLWHKNYTGGYELMQNGFALWEQGSFDEGLAALQTGVTVLKAQSESVDEILEPYTMEP